MRIESGAAAALRAPVLDQQEADDRATEMREVGDACLRTGDSEEQLDSHVADDRYPCGHGHRYEKQKYLRLRVQDRERQQQTEYTARGAQCRIEIIGLEHRSGRQLRYRGAKHAGEIEQREARSVELDVEAITNFAESVLTDAARLWQEMKPDQQQRFQKVLFPKGVQYSAGVYRTAQTCIMFNDLQPEELQNPHLVALPGIEPGF